MNIYLSLLVAILGAFCYAIAANPKAAELGRISFAIGGLAFLLRVGAETFNLLK